MTKWMKRTVFAAAILLVGVMAARAASPAPLSNLEIVHGLRAAEAAQAIPAEIAATVSYFRPDARLSNLGRSPDDIAVLAEPLLLNAHTVAWFFAALLVVALTIGILGWHLEYSDRRKMVSLAYLERRRARILEDINHSRPLEGILERITELVSARLNGAACWCHVADGATLGNRPAQPADASLRTVEYPIPSRSGPALGSLRAAFDAHTTPCPAEQEALAMAASLATLAIETSRLYADLVHRSEFDLLTDVQNRFYMEKKLTALTQSARQTASVFGLIYIDLNQFKRVNDDYGHLAGDHYLQEAAQRMKKQLRAGDTLARLGGDEFAVLVPEVHTREEVEEIALRLECCFQEPFVNDGLVLRGSAAVGIALYPEDADTVDGLLSAADESMYVAKNAHAGKYRELDVEEEALTRGAFLPFAK